MGRIIAPVQKAWVFVMFTARKYGISIELNMRQTPCGKEVSYPVHRKGEKEKERVPSSLGEVYLVVVVKMATVRGRAEARARALALMLGLVSRCEHRDGIEVIGIWRLV